MGSTWRKTTGTAGRENSDSEVEVGPPTEDDEEDKRVEEDGECEGPEEAYSGAMGSLIALEHVVDKEEVAETYMIGDKYVAYVHSRWGTYHFSELQAGSDKMICKRSSEYYWATPEDEVPRQFVCKDCLREAAREQ